MDILVERLDAKLREWEPNIAAIAKERISEIIDLADQDALDIMPLARCRNRRFWTYSIEPVSR